MSRTTGLRPRPAPPIIHAGSQCALGAMAVGAAQTGALVSGASPWSDAADFILCYPFVLDAPTPVYKVWWWNGSSVGSNYDIAIYDEGYNFIASTGASTAGSGSAGLPQAVALSATVVLSPGRYYCGMVCNATTTNRVTRWSITTYGAGFWMAAGCFKSNATDTPPIASSAITPADYTNVAFPVFGLITRTGFDL